MTHGKPVFGSRGKACLAPTCGIDQVNNSMDVVRHDHKCCGGDVIKMSGNLIPTICRHLPKIVQGHLSLNDLAKQTRPSLRDDGDEIRAGQRIIKIGQAHRMTMHVVGLHGRAGVWVEARLGVGWGADVNEQADRDKPKIKINRGVNLRMDPFS